MAAELGFVIADKELQEARLINERDFANGYIVAEILSKYYPIDVQMHSFDSGTAIGAKKNNWGILERIFTKYSIPIPRELYVAVTNCDSKSISILLSIIYGHVNSKTPPPDGIMATSINLIPVRKEFTPNRGSSKPQWEERNDFTVSSDRITIHSDIKEYISADPLSINQMPMSKLPIAEPTEKEDTGKLMCIRCICSIFGISEPQITFYRNMFQSNTVRELIIANIEKKPAAFKEELMARMITEKNIILTDKNSTGMPKSPGSEYIFFLSAFSAIGEFKAHSSTNQLTVFHLSECLTIINSYKGSEQRRSLLETDQVKTADQSSALYYPAYEVTAVLHILASIIKCNVSLKLRVLSDVICSALRIFFKIALHQLCPKNIRKAYVAVTLALLDPKYEAYNDIQEMGIINDLLGVLTLSLRRFDGECLRDCKFFIYLVIYLISPHLFTHQCLCTLIVRAMLELENPFFDQFIALAGLKVRVSWDVPFLFQIEQKPLLKSWYSFGIIMGTLKSSQDPKVLLDYKTLQILLTIMLYQKELPKMENDESIEDVQLFDPASRIPIQAMNYIFNVFSDHIITCLSSIELFQPAWQLLMTFMVLCDHSLVIKKFPAILAILLHAHTLDRSKCKRKLLSRLRKLVTFTKKEDEDRNIPFNSMDPRTVEIYQTEAIRILRVFRTDFPFIAANKVQ
ncbi:spermatogenesis-associated protein 4 [Terramyces sp. JEL0728]|nr:spermatogenesis-associated protein 4 [Terramyces sp. JEL0728]